MRPRWNDYNQANPNAMTPANATARLSNQARIGRWVKPISNCMKLKRLRQKSIVKIIRLPPFGREDHDSALLRLGAHSGIRGSTSGAPNYLSS